jgi:hypothetical protein
VITNRLFITLKSLFSKKNPNFIKGIRIFLLPIVNPITVAHCKQQLHKLVFTAFPAVCSISEVNLQFFVAFWKRHAILTSQRYGITAAQKALHCSTFAPTGHCFGSLSLVTGKVCEPT